VNFLCDIAFIFAASEKLASMNARTMLDFSFHATQRIITRNQSSLFNFQNWVAGLYEKKIIMFKHP